MPTLAPFRPSVDMTALPPCADPLFATHTFHNASNDFKDRPSFEVRFVGLVHYWGLGLAKVRFPCSS